MPTEDHPLQYSEFEGTIPEGEYGAGTMIVWDRGTYENLLPDSLAESLDRGHLKIRLDGEKLRGAFSLRRMPARGERSSWLLVKIKDEHATAAKDILAASPESVLSGRTVEEIAKRG